MNEAIGVLEVDVRVFNPPDRQNNFPVTIELVIQTVSGSASKYTKLVYMYNKIVLILFVH